MVDPTISSCRTSFVRPQRLYESVTPQIQRSRFQLGPRERETCTGGYLTASTLPQLLTFQEEGKNLAVDSFPDIQVSLLDQCVLFGLSVCLSQRTLSCRNVKAISPKITLKRSGCLFLTCRRACVVKGNRAVQINHKIPNRITLRYDRPSAPLTIPLDGRKLGFQDC